MYTTTDGHLYTDYRVRVLIGASLPTQAQRQEAIVLLREALQAGVTRGDLWRLANTAIWDGLDTARRALEHLTQSPLQPTEPLPDAMAPITEPIAHRQTPREAVMQTILIEP
jgi:hypothetical protein